MAKPFYSSHGLNVAAYDERAEQNSPISGDVDFYLGLAREASGDLLELACGTARVALPLARAGHTVVGLDLSEAMLDVARMRLQREPEDTRRQLSLIHGDMREFDLGRSFGIIIIAARSFQMLLTPEEEERCLEAIRRHLLPGGRLVIDVFDPLLHLLLPGPVSSQTPLRTESEGTHPDSGHRITVGVLNRTNNTLDQVLEETWRFTELASDGSILREEEEVLRMRWIYRWEMRYLLERCGFEVLAEYSDFEKSPPAYGKEQVWLATPA